MRYKHRLALLASEDGTTDTADTIPEGEADTSDKEVDKNTDSKKEEGDYVPEEEPAEGNQEDAPEDPPAEDDNPDAADGGEEMSGEDATPAEQKPRHDAEVNSTDIVVKASNVMRAAREIASDKGVATEDNTNHDDLEALYQSADGEGKSFGRIALELEEGVGKYRALTDCAESFSQVQDAMNDPYEDSGVSGVGLECIHVLMSRIIERHQLPKVAMRGVGREAFMGKMNDSQRRQLALEGFGEMFKAMIDAICNAFARLWKWIKDFFSVANDKMDKTKIISKKLDSRAKDLKKEYDSFSQEKKELVDSLFSVCQRFDSGDLENSFSGIPSALKSSEEKIKKLIQERGYRLKRSDIPTFYTSGGFVSPSENWDKLKQKLKNTTVLFEKVCAVSGIVGENVAEVVKKTNDWINAEEGKRDEELGKILSAYKTFCEGFFLGSESAGLFEECETDEIIRGLSLRVPDKLLVRMVKDEKYLLPDEKMLLVVSPLKQEVTAQGEITVVGAYGEILSDLKFRFENQPLSIGREDGYVDHTKFEDIHSSLAGFIENYLDEIDGVLKAQTKRYEKVGKELIEQINKTKQSLSQVNGADKALILNLNTFSALISEVFAGAIPNMSKTLISFALDYCKHVQQSLNAFEVCLETVK